MKTLSKKNNLACLILSVYLDNLDVALASHKLQEAINLAKSSLVLRKAKNIPNKGEINIKAKKAAIK